MQGTVAQIVKNIILTEEKKMGLELNGEAKLTDKVTELTELLRDLCIHTQEEYYLPSAVAKWYKENQIVEKKYSEVDERILSMIETIVSYAQEYDNVDHRKLAIEILEDVRSDITDINTASGKKE